MILWYVPLPLGYPAESSKREWRGQELNLHWKYRLPILFHNDNEP